MRRAPLFILAGLAAFATVYLALPPREPQLVDPAEISATAGALERSPGETPMTERRARADAAGESAPADIRDVTPANMTAAPPVTLPLRRIAPEEAELRLIARARMERVFNPLVVSAGSIRAREREIRLAGIAAPDFDRRCGEGASAWPCGRMARAALRRFVRGRAIECEIPAGAKDLPDPARCEVAGEDIAAWLVAQGWAKAAGDAYAGQEAAARTLKLGLWGEGRPDAQPEVAGGLESSPASAFAISDRVSSTP